MAGLSGTVWAVQQPETQFNSDNDPFVVWTNLESVQEGVIPSMVVVLSRPLWTSEGYFQGGVAQDCRGRELPILFHRFPAQVPQLERGTVLEIVGGHAVKSKMYEGIFGHSMTLEIHSSSSTVIIVKGSPIAPFARAEAVNFLKDLGDNKNVGVGPVWIRSVSTPGKNQWNSERCKAIIEDCLGHKEVMETSPAFGERLRPHAASDTKLVLYGINTSISKKNLFIRAGYSAYYEIDTSHTPMAGLEAPSYEVETLSDISVDDAGSFVEVIGTLMTRPYLNTVTMIDGTKHRDGRFLMLDIRTASSISSFGKYDCCRAVGRLAKEGERLTLVDARLFMSDSAAKVAPKDIPSMSFRYL